MIYRIPFLNAVKFMCCNGMFGFLEYYIRMKIFLLFCASYYVNTVNIHLKEEDDCGFLSDVRDLVTDNILGIILVTWILALTKPQAEILGEIGFVIILSIWVNLFPIHFVIKLGHHATSFKVLLEALLGINKEIQVEGDDQPLSHFNWPLMYASVISSFMIQGQISDWLLEITVREVTRTEQILMQILMAVPVLGGALIKHIAKTISIHLLDWLPYIGILPAAVPCFSALFHVQSPPNPLIFAIPLEKFKGINNTMGTIFVFKWFYLQLKLCIKYNFLTYEAMTALRFYFVSRVLLNISRMPKELMNFDGCLDTLLGTFQQDYMSVLASAAWISKFYREFAKKGFIRLAHDSKTQLVDRHALGFIPSTYIFLGFINVTYSCDTCEKMDHFYEIMKFVVLEMLMYSYSASWMEAINNVSFLSLHKHAVYLKMFLALFALPIVVIICYMDEEDPPACNTQRCSYFGACTNDMLCENFEGYDIQTAFALQLSGFNLLSLVVIISLMFYAWIFLSAEEENETYESLLVSSMMGLYMFESMISFYIFYIARSQCGDFREQTKHYLLVSMGFLNAWNTIIERGCHIGAQIRDDYRDMTGVMNNMKILNEDQLEDEEDPECSICEDDIEDNGRLTQCGHLFHSFCIKEWVAEYGPICPECNAVLQQARRPLVVLLSSESDEQFDAPDPEVPPEMLMKIVEEMEKFDYKTTFFSELVDTENPADDEEEEEDWDDDYDD